MRKYLGIVSIIILVKTYLILAYTFVGQVGGPTDTIVLLTGVGLSVLAALFSKRGSLKIVCMVSQLAVLSLWL